MALQLPTNNHPPPSQPQLPSLLSSPSNANGGGSGSFSPSYANVGGFSSTNNSNYADCFEDYFPPGYRFRPHDDELIDYYLRRKIMNEPLSCHMIMEIDIYQYNPERLAEKYKRGRVSEMFFFTPRNRKHPKGKRPNRVAGDGFWKASGAYKPVLNFTGGHIIGFKRSLVFHRGTSNGKLTNNRKTNWIMHEFTMSHPLPINNVDANGSRMDWVICRVYERVKHEGSMQQLPQITSLETDDQISKTDNQINNNIPNIDDDQALSVANHDRAYMIEPHIENSVSLDSSTMQQADDELESLHLLMADNSSGGGLLDDVLGVANKENRSIGSQVDVSKVGFANQSANLHK